MRELVREAIRLDQDGEHPLYLFGLRPDEVLQIADISRIARDEQDSVIGYQRREVRLHVEGIVDYLNQGKVLFPNSLILAFADKISFKGKRGTKAADGIATSGQVVIRVPEEGERKPAWIVDGQQRALALRRTSNTDIPVPIAAIAHADVDLQRQQFLLVNNVRALNKNLVTELLPEVDVFLPRHLRGKRLASEIAGLLDRDPSSPFKDLIKMESKEAASKRRSPVALNSIVQMVTGRLADGGCLSRYCDLSENDTDTSTVYRLLVGYWTAVKNTFPQAWGLAPKNSRLMHGAGLASMGRLMDEVVRQTPTDPDGFVDRCEAELRLISGVCAWTSGEWPGLKRHWKFFEIKKADVDLLSNHLVRTYWNRKP